MPVSFHSHHVRKAAKISSAPWATLITSMTPKISVSPDASRAYTPPIRSPRMIVCTSCVIGTPRRTGGDARPRPFRRSSLLLPIRLRIHDRVAGRHIVGSDDLLVPALPLRQQERLLGRARLVPAERAENGVHRVFVQPVRQRRLVVDRADRLDRGL